MTPIPSWAGVLSKATGRESRIAPSPIAPGTAEGAVATSKYEYQPSARPARCLADDNETRLASPGIELSFVGSTEASPRHEAAPAAVESTGRHEHELNSSAITGSAEKRLRKRQKEALSLDPTKLEEHAADNDRFQTPEKAHSADTLRCTAADVAEQLFLFQQWPTPARCGKLPPEKMWAVSPRGCWRWGGPRGQIASPR
jgi:hypothetical protein